MSTDRKLLKLGQRLSSWITFTLVCACTAYAGSHLQANWQAFDATRDGYFGQPHEHLLQVLVSTPDGALTRVAYSDLPAFTAAHPGYSLTVPGNRLPVVLATPRHGAQLSYRVLSQRDGRQLVETRYQDHETNVVGAYVVDGNALTPLYVRSWELLLVGTSLLFFGLPLAIALSVAGRALRRHEERVILARGEQPYPRRLSLS